MRLTIKTHWKSLLCWTFALVWTGVIFMMSLESGEKSSQTSGQVTEIVINVLDIEPTPEAISTTGYFVRETAHFLEFLLLGALLYLAYTVSKAHRPFPYTALTGMALALTDESIQTLVPGRAFELFPDFVLDSLGVLLGSALCLIFIKQLCKLLKRKSKTQRTSFI